MSIEHLKLRIESLRREKDSYAKRCDQDIAAIEKELAALEAQERKPREWSVVLMSDGRMMCSADFQDSFLGYPPPPRTPLSETIKVREVKPIVITKAKAARMHHEWAKTCIDYDHPNGWVNALKAIGLDAVEAE